MKYWDIVREGRTCGRGGWTTNWGWAELLAGIRLPNPFQTLGHLLWSCRQKPARQTKMEMCEDIGGPKRRYFSTEWLSLHSRMLGPRPTVKGSLGVGKHLFSLYIFSRSPPNCKTYSVYARFAQGLLHKEPEEWDTLFQQQLSNITLPDKI